jgi:hypothetical protein
MILNDSTVVKGHSTQVAKTCLTVVWNVYRYMHMDLKERGWIGEGEGRGEGGWVNLDTQ